MAKKKNITQEKIIEWYMNTVLSSGQPNSIFSFAKENNFEEAEFYKHFSSFESLEKAVFGIFAKETIHLLHKTEAYKDYLPKDKLLSFYFLCLLKQFLDTSKFVSIFIQLTTSILCVK